MSERKFVVPQTLTLIRKPVIYFAVIVAIIVGALTPVAAHAQSGSEVYKKMSDLYSFAKSYQGTVVRVQKGKSPDGKPATQTVTIKISFKAPNKYVVNTLTSIDIGVKSQSFDQTMVSDGKTSYIFSPERKRYQREQIPNLNMLAKFFAVLNPSNGFLLLPESTVNGLAVFVIKPSLPLNATPAQLEDAKKVKIILMIDKRTFQLIKMTMESPTGSLVQSVGDQVMMGTLPDSLFAWTPPAGYKEVKPKAPPSSGPTAPRKHTGPIVPGQPISP